MKDSDIFDSRNNLPEFVVPFDGTQPEIASAERDLVAERFDPLVGGLIDRFDDVRERFESFSLDVVHLRLPVDEVESWSVALERVNPMPDNPPPDKVAKSISLEHFFGKVVLERVEYRLSADGIVRRWDSSNVPMTLEEVQHNLWDVGANNRLQVEMGFNNQPIGEGEIDGLSEMVQQPEMIPWRYDSQS